MSENNSSNELNNVIEEFVENANVITVPIDATLSNSGEAADAKAVGDALADKADRSELQTAVKVNGQSADAQGLIILLASHIPVSDTQNAQNIAQVLNALGQKTGSDIRVSSDPNAETIAEAVASAGGRTADVIKMSTASDAQTISQALAALQTLLDTQGGAIAALDAKTGSTIKLTTAQDSETIAAAIAAIRSGRVLKVNGVGPDASGNVILVTVPYAENLASEDTIEEHGSFIRRTTAGSASISDGSAWLQKMQGNSVHEGFVAEVLTVTPIPVTRPTPAGITAELDKATFIAYVSGAGTYELTYDGSAWSATPANYGVTVSGTPESGDSITIVWDGEADPVMTVSSPRQPDPAITVTIDRAAFVAEVSSSGTINLYFTTEWSTDPATYGVTVTGTPLAGDQIQIVYVKEERGTITQATPTALVGTGWNLYESANGYARVIPYDEESVYKVGGTYTGLLFKEALTDEGTAIEPDEDGLFQVEEAGYVVVTGGSTDTYILTTWSDWEEGYEGEYQGYTESTVNLAALMASKFPYGLMKVGSVYDEIDLNAQTATSRVERVAYSAEARATAEASGRAYDFDEDYIYIERAEPVVSEIEQAGEYTVCEHGLEYIAGTDVPVYCEIIYGENLKDKLRRDVVTVRAQTFSATQQARARTNIGAAAAAELTADEAALAKVQESLAYIVGDTNTSGQALAVGTYVYVRGHATIPDGLRKVIGSSAIATDGAITTSNTEAESGGVINSLSGNITTINSDIAYDGATVAKANCSYTDTGVIFKKRGGVITVTVNGFQSLPQGGWTTICSIPSGFIPPRNDICDVYADSDNAGSNIRIIRFRLSKDGTFNVYNYGAALTNANCNPRGVFIV